MKQIAREPVGGIPSVVLQPRFIPKVLDLPTECLDPRKSFLQLPLEQDPNPVESSEKGANHWRRHKVLLV